jgi:hypothetical protein
MGGNPPKPTSSMLPIADRPDVCDALAFAEEQGWTFRKVFR